MPLVGIWPPLPIIVTNYLATDRPMPEDFDFNAVFVHPGRISEIHLVFLTCLQLQRLAMASVRPERFTALVHLTVHFKDSRPGHLAPVLPDGFLGRYAPRLQSLELNSIPFPALPKLLLSAIDLVRLTLHRIPHSGYFSPEALVTALAVLTNLTYFIVEFESSLSRPDLEIRRRPPPLTRTILPALTRFQFQGVSEYFEGVVARIDAPLLDTIWITFFHEPIFDIPKLARFMRRTPRLQGLNKAHVGFDYSGVQIGALPLGRTVDDKSRLKISCGKVDKQLSSLAQVLTSFLPSIDVVEDLYIYRPGNLASQWQDDIENRHWVEIFRPLTAVRNLYVCKEFAQCIAPALQELVRERALPALENLFLEAPHPSGPALSVQEATCIIA